MADYALSARSAARTPLPPAEARKWNARARAPAMSVPKKRFAEMTALEYFRHAIERAETDETRRRRAASTRAPLPSPPSGGFRREDYCEMSAAWDPATFRKTRKNEARRAVYSLTVVRSPPTA